VCSFGTSAGRDTEEIDLFQLCAPGEVIEKITASGAGQKVPLLTEFQKIQQALAKDGSFKGTPNGSGTHRQWKRRENSRKRMG